MTFIDFIITKFITFVVKKVIEKQCMIKWDWEA